MSKVGLISTVFTFSYPPEHFFSNNYRLLTEFRYRQDMILEQGIAQIAWLDFSHEFAKMPSEQFITDFLLKQLNCAHIVCGYNYHFGHRAQGNAQMLQEYAQHYGFTIDIVPAYKTDGLVVSSTKIREALAQGDVLLAAQMLGRYHSYYGQVIPGKQLGRKLGFPTANFKVSSQLQLPASGVYLTWCYLPDGSSYPAMTSLGNNPTIANQQDFSMEAYLLDFAGDLYDQVVEIQFLHRMRDMETFPSIDDLQAQLQKDRQTMIELLPHFHLQKNRIVLQ